MKKCNKKKGFTLVEVLVSLVVMGIAVSAIFYLFENSNRTISETEIKSQLQEDVQVIQERFSKLGMEAMGVEEVIFKAGSTEEIQMLKLKSVMVNDNKYSIFQFEIVDKDLVLDTYEYTKDAFGNFVPNLVKSKKLSENIKSIIVKPTNSSVTDLKNATAIDVNITVEKSKGRITKDLIGQTIVTFRNKN